MNLSLSIYISIYLSIYLSLSLSIYIYIYICIHVTYRTPKTAHLFYLIDIRPISVLRFWISEGLTQT